MEKFTKIFFKALTMVTGTTSNPTNAKTRTNARKLKTITAQKMPLAEILMVVSSAHVMLDTRVMVSHALKPTVNINFFDSMSKWAEM